MFSNVDRLIHAFSIPNIRSVRMEVSRLVKYRCPGLYGLRYFEYLDEMKSISYVADYRPCPIDSKAISSLGVGLGFRSGDYWSNQEVIVYDPYCELTVETDECECDFGRFFRPGMDVLLKLYRHSDIYPRPVIVVSDLVFDSRYVDAIMTMHEGCRPVILPDENFLCLWQDSKPIACLSPLKLCLSGSARLLWLKQKEEDGYALRRCRS